MIPHRLKSKILVQAGIRSCAALNIPAFVLRSGDEDAGQIFIKVNLLGPGCTVFTQIRDLDGNLQWMAGSGDDPVSEPDADAYIDRQARMDPDLWVVEIEDREGRNPFEDII